MMSYHATMNNANRAAFTNLSLNAKKNTFWRFIKNRNTYARYTDGVPGYLKAGEVDHEGRVFKNSELANQFEYM